MSGLTKRELKLTQENKQLKDALSKNNERADKLEQTAELGSKLSRKNLKPFSITITGDKDDKSVDMESSGLKKQEVVFFLKLALVNAEEELRNA